MSSAMQQRLDAVIRAQHVPRPLLDLLTMVVAHCLDTDTFKQASASRLGVLESLVKMPTQEIASARAATVAALDEMQRNVAVLEARFRKTHDDMRAESTLRLEQITVAARQACEDMEHMRGASREEFADQIAAHRNELRETVEVEVARGRDALHSAVEGAQKGFARRAQAIGVEAVEGINAMLEEQLSDARAALSSAASGATSVVRRLVSDAEVSVKSATGAAVNFLSTAFDTINALPLLECHRLTSTVAMLEARLDVALERDSRLAGPHVVALQQSQLSSALQRLQRVEMLVGQLQDRAEALQAMISNPDPQRPVRAAVVLSSSATAAVSPIDPATRQSRAGAYSNSASAARNSSYAASLRDTMDAGAKDLLRSSWQSSPTRTRPASPSRAFTAADDDPRVPAIMLRLQARLDALELSVLDAKAVADDAVSGVRALGGMIDERVVAPVEAAVEQTEAIWHVFQIEPAQARELHERHRQEELAGFDDLRARHFHNNGVVAPSPTDIENARRHRQLRHASECARWLLNSAPILKLLRPLTPLGLELADGPLPFGGVVVLSVVEGGAGEACGLRCEDVLLKIGDTPVESRSDLHYALCTWPSRRGGTAPTTAEAVSKARATVYRPELAVVVHVDIPV